MYEYFMKDMVKHIQNAHKSKINRQSQKFSKHNLCYHTYKKLEKIMNLTKKLPLNLDLKWILYDFLKFYEIY